MYIKKKDRDLINLLDKILVLPAGWNKFILKQSIQHNLIIKNMKEYYCTYCNKTFKPDEHISVNDKCKCPHCKNTYLVKTHQLRTYVFTSDLAILDRIQGYWVERLFRLESFYDRDKNKITSEWFEWGRNVFYVYGGNFVKLLEIINDNVCINISNTSIHNRVGRLDHHWRISDSYYAPGQWIDEFVYYSGNLKKLLADIEDYKYSQLWKLSQYTSFNIIYLLENYNQSIEILTKMRMYNLALNPKTFGFKKLSDYISKDYYSFIRKYNLTIRELEALSILRKRDISLIRKAADLTEIHSLAEKVNIEKAFQLTDLSEKNCSEYIDYLEIAERLKLNMKDKRVLYPKSICEEHNKIMKQWKDKKDASIIEGIEKRYKELIKNKFQNKKYTIFPASSIEELINESQQQNNCVRTYVESYAAGKCDIYFMRYIEDPSKSLVTVEVKNNKIVQQRTKNNNDTNESQKKFLLSWENKILKGS